MTLNVLLSFAQFEREVTGERIRDKIAASRAKGMWMGGNIPLGYDLGDRKLELNGEEADTVRHIFTRYLELKSMPALAKELANQGIHSKRWTSSTGKVHGGLAFHVGALAYILRNKVYRGYAVHKGKAHKGEHEAIVPADLFNQVQQQIDDNRIQKSVRKTRAASSPLCGKIYDADGQPMSVSFSYGRGKRIYRYYISGCLLPRTAHIPTNRTGQRLSATRIEKALDRGLSPLSIAGENALTDAVRKVTLLTGTMLVEIDVGLTLPNNATSGSILLRKAGLIDPDARIDRDILHLTVALPADRRGRTKRSPDTAMVAGDTKLQLAALVRKAHQRLADMKASPLEPLSHSQMKAAPSEWIRRHSGIGLLAPDIQKALLTGTAPAHVTPDWMLAQEWPVGWDAQRRMISMGT